MKKENFIAAIEFCSSHNIEISFLNILNENGLIDIETVDDTIYIHESQLQELERIVHFYYELGINLEGIETIIYLLQKSESLQSEITAIRNRLRFYEEA